MGDQKPEAAWDMHSQRGTVRQGHYTVASLLIMGWPTLLFPGLEAGPAAWLSGLSSALMPIFRR